MRSLWWVLLLVSTWGTLFLASDPQRLRRFWTGGLWSIGLAMLGESLIRSRIDYFVARSLILPFLGTDFLNFLGPRFVEGVLFMQTLRPSRKLLQASLWVLGIVISEMTLALTGQVQLSWNGIGLALAVHTLRFLSLLGIYDALDYGQMRQQSQGGSENQSAKGLFPPVNPGFWVYGWPIFGVGSAVALKVARGLNRFGLRQGE